MNAAIPLPPPFGAHPDDWTLLEGLGLAADLLPVVSHPGAPISPDSTLKERGKVPSEYNSRRQIRGFKDWTNFTATPADIAAWRAEPDYGICIQTRQVRAVDVDVTDPELAAEVERVIAARLGVDHARRGRADSSKFLIAFTLPGELTKRAIHTRAGRIEFLATGQQFIAHGTHPSGARYEWRGLPVFLPVDLATFETLWTELDRMFATEPAQSTPNAATDWVEAARAVQFAKADTWFEILPPEQKVAEVRAIASTWTVEQATNRDLWRKNLRSIADAVERGLDHETGVDIAEEFSSRTTDNNLAGRDEIEQKMFEANRPREVSIYAAAAVASRSGYVIPPRRAVIPPPPPVPEGSRSLPMAAPPTAHALTMNKRAQFEATLENLSHVLSTQGLATLGFDDFRGRIMVAPVGTSEWRPITDTDQIHFRETLGRSQNFAAIGKELMRDALQLVAERFKFDTAVTWLNSLAWDQVPRVDTFLTRYCGAADDDYSRAVSRYIWSGLAGRVLSPGCQLDMVVALQSPQGKQKSTGLQAMVPDPEFFTDGLSLHQDDDDFKRLIRGKLVVEIAELAGLSRADINVVKRTITRRHEEWIEKFQTQPTRFPRRCMLFATTNDERFLPADDTGQRRWLPVEIGRLDRERIAADRAQLWAEGAAIYRSAGIAWADAERLAAGLHAKYEQSDVWEPVIEQWLNTPTVGPPPGPPPRHRPLTIPEVLTGALRMNVAAMDSKTEKRVARALRSLGMERKTMRRDGRLAKWWIDAASGDGA